MTRPDHRSAAARAARTQDNSPRGYKWHARRLFGADVDVDALTEQQWETVADERLSYLRAKSAKAVQARQLGRARRLRERADAIEAEVRRSESA